MSGSTEGLVSWIFFGILGLLASSVIGVWLAWTGFYGGSSWRLFGATVLLCIPAVLCLVLLRALARVALGRLFPPSPPEPREP